MPDAGLLRADGTWDAEQLGRIAYAAFNAEGTKRYGLPLHEWLTDTQRGRYEAAALAVAKAVAEALSQHQALWECPACGFRCPSDASPWHLKFHADVAASMHW